MITQQSPHSPVSATPATSAVTAIPATSATPATSAVTATPATPGAPATQRGDAAMPDPDDLSARAIWPAIRRRFGARKLVGLGVSVLVTTVLPLIFYEQLQHLVGSQLAVYGPVGLWFLAVGIRGVIRRWRQHPATRPGGCQEAGS